MTNVTIITAWAGTGVEFDSYRCPALDVLQALGTDQFTRIYDLGQPNVPPNPNICIWQIEGLSAAAVTALEAAGYEVMVV